MTKMAPLSPAAQKRRTIEEAVDAAMVRYRQETDAVAAKTARLRALREAREAEETDKH
ncbi:hypothetical protein GCM10007301_16700 [Azorhizobium oxalatiphilum]|uniref:Uncharacterized protein n=2 Tax=Azorhizobium oxalatiphilum TaxID=980631 RepID=A0A917BWP4_9HYPH|nr:hypothetical protein GCM10007301_16700 [Azorhizobium oxalatiphilum]